MYSSKARSDTRCFDKACLNTAVEGLRWLRDLVEKRYLIGVQCCTSSKQQRWETLELDDCDAAAPADSSASPASSPSAPGFHLPCSDGQVVHNNIVLNPTFSDGTRGWLGRGCSLSVGTCLGSSFCVAQGRTESSHGLVQSIGAKLDKSTAYRVEAWVGMRSAQGGDRATVRATLTLKPTNASEGGDERILLSSADVQRGQWSLLTGTIPSGSNGGQPRDGDICIDGPDGGIDILVGSVAVVPTATTVRSAEIPNENGEAQIGDIQSSNVVANLPVRPSYPDYDVNVITNNDFKDGLRGWYAMGNSTLTVESGGPPPPERRRSLDNSQPRATSSGKYVCCSNRTETYEGPAQDLTDKITLFQSYQMFAWIATSLPFGSCVVDVSIDVDGVWMQAGETTVGLEWVQVRGAFRLEEQPKSLYVYLQGPAKGIDVKLTGLEIFAVDRLARTPYLRQRASEIRQRDVVLKVRDCDGRLLSPGTRVGVRQNTNSFPLGSCINRDNLGDAFYTKFYLENFNWAVFENELKWEQTQAVPWDTFYKDADEMAQFCRGHNIPMRGHCIVWDVENRVPDWVTELEGMELLAAVEDRVAGLLNRYKGQFEQYDVNNEMLQGDFYEEKLGADFLPFLFKFCHDLDPHATLFVNEYDVENNFDCTASPERYVELVRFLLENGAPVGGIGVQGHIRVPMGTIIANALDVLSEVNLPIWFTELDFSSLDVNVRADDLEVVLRELFAHPAVEGCMLWGFMDGAMDRENGCLIDKDHSINPAGRRLLELKKEWTTNFDGVVNRHGEIDFRGYHGNYTLSVDGGPAGKTFDVTQGDGQLVLNLTTDT